MFGGQRMSDLIELSKELEVIIMEFEMKMDAIIRRLEDDNN